MVLLYFFEEDDKSYCKDILVVVNLKTLAKPTTTYYTDLEFKMCPTLLINFIVVYLTQNCNSLHKNIFEVNMDTSYD